ncbi:MAG: purine-nucleoside phosphorylase [Eubacteriaceae bacterium]|nr:purine-nucleoside phosphorylase [Eubacteriaceae bacterium]
MTTVHNQAQKGDIADLVLMPGDPLRAKHVAEKYLSNAKQVNSVRGMLAFTGSYNGKHVSVMGSGMGMPSIGIYSYELFDHYEAKKIIRIGTCGAYLEDINVADIILAQGACTNSAYTSQNRLNGVYAPISDFSLLLAAYEASQKIVGSQRNVRVGNVLSSDVFYTIDPDEWKKWRDMGVLAVEMEAAALYFNAARLGGKALAILTVSDNLATGESSSSEVREKSFTQMAQIALELA